MSEHAHPANTASTACAACREDGEQLRQRMQRGFADEDLWSFDHYLAELLAAALTRFAEMEVGCPGGLTGGDLDARCIEWQEILAEMAVGFQAYVDNGYLKPPPPELNRSLDLLKEWWGDLWI